MIIVEFCLRNLTVDIGRLWYLDQTLVFPYKREFCGGFLITLESRQGPLRQSIRYAHCRANEWRRFHLFVNAANEDAWSFVEYERSGGSH